jgi:amidase
MVTKPQADRRSFLRIAGGVLLAAPFISRFPRARASSAYFDPSFGSASQAVRALRVAVISSRELVEHTFSRISKFNARINAFVTLNEQQAMDLARQADESLARGSVLGPLHGLPIVIKDVFATAGVRTTYGSKTLAEYIPKEDSVAVARLRKAGAIIIGKTSTPAFAADHQTYNDVSGTTNNPWDLSKSPGGSTGGGAAALAAGLGFLELGSDLGGSIRNPSHFCGIYGHKSSLELVSRRGPRRPGGPMASLDNLWVVGPMARSAQDLQLELELIGGPAPGEAVAYRWALPPPRGTRLRDYRIGYVLTDPFCPPTSEVSDLMSNAVEAIRRQGAQLDEGWPSGVEFSRMFEDYYFLLQTSAYQKEEDLKKSIDSLKGRDDYYSVRRLEALSASHQQWRVRDGMRLAARATWDEYFRRYDAFLMPANFAPAFPHDQQANWDQRSIQTSEGKRTYRDIVRWISMATLTGCPATVAPIGKTKKGLPVGIQIMGPFLEDATSINIAGLIADGVGGFEPPPGYLDA